MSETTFREARLRGLTRRIAHAREGAARQTVKREAIIRQLGLAHPRSIEVTRQLHRVERARNRLVRMRTLCASELERIKGHETRMRHVSTGEGEATMTDVAAQEVRPESVAMGARTLKALTLIKSVGDTEPFAIVLLVASQGTAMTASELMAARVKWASKAGYRVLSNNVPDTLAPYNAVIRLSETGTEDHNLDYLAHII